MSVPPRIECSYRVRFDEAGANGYVRSSGLLRFAQDLAWIHSEGAGFGRRWYSERGLTWLIRSIELEILDDVPYGEQVTVSTEVIGFRRVWARRRSEFTQHGSERTVASALIDWVLLNSRGAPVRVPPEILEAFVTPPGVFTPIRMDLPEPPADASRLEFSARLSELDPLGHVNNAAYLDYVDEHLASVGRRGEIRRRPRRYRVEFAASAEPEVGLVGSGWDDGPAWLYRLAGVDGRELVRARFETDPQTWVGG